MTTLEWILAVSLAVWALARLGPVLVDLLRRGVVEPVRDRRRAPTRDDDG